MTNEDATAAAAANAAVAAAAAQETANAAAAAASAAATTNWPSGGYNMFIPLLFISMSAVLVICVDVPTISLVHAYIIKFQYVISTAHILFMIYSWINLIEQLLKYSTIQKPNMCRQFSIQGLLLH